MSRASELLFTGDVIDAATAAEWGLVSRVVPADALMAEAERAGATVTRPAHDAFWGGRTGYFADPDGHLWEIAWNPAWPIDAEGRVQFRAPG